jgi:hypothetical protein
MTVRILIVDDHAVVRPGLRLLLQAEEDLEPVKCLVFAETRHRAHIMQELRLSSRAELVRHAYRRGCSTRTSTASTTRDEDWPSCLM